MRRGQQWPLPGESRSPGRPAPPKGARRRIHRMKGYTTALSLSLLLGVAGLASAATATLDFDTGKLTDASVPAGANGATTTVKEGTVNAVQTGGTAGNQYLYVDVKDGLIAAGKTL